MGVPKKRTSKMRRDRRRAANNNLKTPPNVVLCQKCREPIMSHTVCKNCGTYKKRAAIAVAE